MSYKKEWLKEWGYCNCQLVVMSRLQIFKMELHSNQEVPNLEQLTQSRSDTVEWLKKQEFQYPSLDPKKVIRIHWEKLGISRWLKFGKNKKGEIIVYDCVGDNGPLVKRRFEFELVKSDGVSSLIISQSRDLTTVETSAAR